MVTYCQARKKVLQILSFYHPAHKTVFLLLAKRDRYDITFGVFFFRKGKIATLHFITQKHLPVQRAYHAIYLSRSIPYGI